MDSQQFDAKELMERVSDDADLLHQLIDLFTSRSVELIDELKGQVDAPDADKVTKAAHQLRGMLANMSGHRACDLAARLEDQGRRAQLGSLAQQVQTLEGAVVDLTADLQRFAAVKTN